MPRPGTPRVPAQARGRPGASVIPGWTALVLEWKFVLGWGSHGGSCRAGMPSAPGRHGARDPAGRVRVLVNERAGSWLSSRHRSHRLWRVRASCDGVPSYGRVGSRWCRAVLSFGRPVARATSAVVRTSGAASALRTPTPRCHIATHRQVRSSGSCPLGLTFNRPRTTGEPFVGNIADRTTVERIILRA
eukprot:1156254-Prymnesium_polylepis.1